MPHLGVGINKTLEKTSFDYSDLYMCMLKMCVQMSGFILWSFVAMQQVFKDLERFNGSKIGSKDRNLPSRQPKSAHIFKGYQ